MEKVNISFADEVSEWPEDKLVADAREELMDMLVKNQERDDRGMSASDDEIPDEHDRIHFMNDDVDESSDEEMDNFESPMDQTHVARLETENKTWFNTQ